MSNFNGELLLTKGNWRIRRARDDRARLWHSHHGGAAMEFSTRSDDTMRCCVCHAKAPAALRGLVMITNWES